jgi:hypothetical protein
MSLTFTAATDEMLAIFKAAWDAGATNPTLVSYPNVAPINGIVLPPATTLSWARVTIQHDEGNQQSLAGALGTQTWERGGILTVQIFVPMGEGLAEAHALAQIAVNAYEGVASAGGAWFRKVRVQETGSDGEFYAVNVLVDFTYTEVK